MNVLEVKEYIREQNGIFNTDEIKKVNSKAIILKKLERMVKVGELKRIEKGLYYLPQKSKFGEIPISVEKFISKYLYLKDERIGYLTGANLFNKYGLTTQIANVIEIATNKRKNTREFDNIKIKFIYNKAPINNANIKYLEILDILKNLKKISDSDINQNYMIMKEKILKLAYEEIIKLLDLAQNYYTPVVIALLGSMVEEKNILKVYEIKKKLNKTTKFKLNLSLENGKEWRIF